MTGRENKDFANSRSRTHSSPCSYAPIRGGRDRQRWVILLGGVKSYPETCAEHGLSRSTSAPASSLSGFSSIFFCKYARALHRPQFSSIEFLHNSEVLNDS